MDKEETYRIKKIKVLLSELDSLFQKKDVIGDIDHIENHSLKYQVIEIEDSFKFIAKRLVLICKTHLEQGGLTNLLSEFNNEIDDYLNDDEKLFSGHFHSESAEYYSEFTRIVRTYLDGFSAFGGHTEKEILKRTGLYYLENILRDTPTILSKLERQPKKETDIYNSVKLILKSTFPDHADPNFSFQKTASCYKPDILIPSLNTAIEYKYATNEKELNKTIDQILIDVKGYNKNITYTLFYAVFYIKTGVCSEARANKIWEEKEFPNNWKPLFIFGK